MPTLYTIAYPRLPADAAAFVDDLRREHDAAAHGSIATHFTLVFGASGVDPGTHHAHVRAVAAASAGPLPFTCRHAMLAADLSGQRAHVFLVPDEGFAAISQLHDRLYTGPLDACLRLDVPYIPHITVATLADRHRARALCTKLNQAGLAIAGQLDQLTIGALHGGQFVDQCAVRLGPG